MDKRREPRLATDQFVNVTLLGDRETRLKARVLNSSGRGVGLSVPVPIVPGTALKIEIEDAVVLGEAIYCRTSGLTYFVGVELDQVLVGLTELARKLKEFGPDSGSQQVNTLEKSDEQYREQTQE
jgi:hypothetical protein